MKTHLRITAVLALLLVTGFAKAQTLQEGIRLTENEQYANAKSVFLKLIAAQPTVGDNYFYFGDLLLKMDDADSAMIVFQKGVNIEPSNPLTHVGLGRALMYSGKMEEGIKELSTAENLIIAQSGKKGTLTPQRQAIIYCEMAETYTYAPIPNIDKAIGYTNTAEALDPNNPDVYLTRGDAMQVKNPVDVTPAVEQYKKAANVDPKSARANVRIGNVYLGGKNPQEAIKYFNIAISIEPNFGPAFRSKGEAWYMLQKFDSATYYFSKYTAMNPDCYAKYRYAVFLYKAGDFDKAIEQGNLVINCDSNLVIVIYRVMARAYMDKKVQEPAKSLVYSDIFFRKQAQFKRPPLAAEDYIYRGKALSALKSDSLAVIEYNKAIVLDSTKRDVYFDLGNSYFKMKKFDMAAMWYKKKYDAEKGGTKAQQITNLNAFARALYLNKEYSRSDSAYTALIALDSTLPFGWLGRARANGQIDKDAAKELARPFYERYFQLATVDSVTKAKNSKDLVDASLYLGSIHLRAKNFACAKAYYLFAQGLDPNNAKAKAALDEDADIKKATPAEIGTCVLPKQ